MSGRNQHLRLCLWDRMRSWHQCALWTAVWAAAIEAEFKLGPGQLLPVDDFKQFECPNTFFLRGLKVPLYPLAHLNVNWNILYVNSSGAIVGQQVPPAGMERQGTLNLQLMVAGPWNPRSDRSFDMMAAIASPCVREGAARRHRGGVPCPAKSVGAFESLTIADQKCPVAATSPQRRAKSKLSAIENLHHTADACFKSCFCNGPRLRL